MAAVDVVASEAVAGLDDEEADAEETEVIDYPLRVDYCGLCSMPPEVSYRTPYLTTEWLRLKGFLGLQKAR